MFFWSVVSRSPSGVDIRFRKALARGQAWHSFNLSYRCQLDRDQYNIYLYVVRGEMLKQTSLTIYCVIIKNVKIEKYIF